MCFFIQWDQTYKLYINQWNFQNLQKSQNFNPCPSRPLAKTIKHIVPSEFHSRLTTWSVMVFSPYVPCFNPFRSICVILWVLSRPTLSALRRPFPRHDKGPSSSISGSEELLEGSLLRHYSKNRQNFNGKH